MKLALLLGAAIAPLAIAGAAAAADTAPAAVNAEAPAAGETLYGRVTSGSGSALPGAEIIVRETGRRAVTDTQGSFSLSGLSAGSVTLELSSQFIGAGKPGVPLDAVVEVLRETKRLVFLRGTVVQGKDDEHLIASFSGIVRKPSR